MSTDDDSEACRTRSKHHNNAFNWKRVSNIRDVAQFTGCVEIGVDNWKRDNFSDSFEVVFGTLLCSSYVPKKLVCNMLKNEKSLSNWTNSSCTEVEHFICREIRYRNKHRKSNTRLPTTWAFKVIHDNEGSTFIEGYSQFSIYGNISVS